MLIFLNFSTSQEPYDSDLMAKEFLMQFAGMALTVGQTLVFSFQDKKLLGLAVKTLEGNKKGQRLKTFCLIKKCSIIFSC